MSQNGVVAGECLALPAVSDLVHAGALKARLERHLAAGGSLTVDASSVQRISSPVFQVLVAGATAFAKAGGGGLTISAPSGAFLEAARTLGLADALGVG